MPIRTAAAPSTSTSSAPTPVPSRPSLTSPPSTSPDPALDEALERISDLAARLWAVRSAHRPVAVGWRRSSLRCAGCGQPAPCATLRAAG